MKGILEIKRYGFCAEYLRMAYFGLLQSYIISYGLILSDHPPSVSGDQPIVGPKESHKSYLQSWLAHYSH